MLYENTVKSVVLIATDVSIGSGVIVSNNEILTNAHVIEGFTRVAYVLHDTNFDNLEKIKENNIFEAEIIAVDQNRDLALLKVNKYLTHTAKFGKNWEIKIANDGFQ